MNILQAIILGIVQGITEFLPISSSGHLVLLHQLFGLNQDQLVFDTLVHFATLLAVFVFFWKKISKISLKEATIIVLANIPTMLVGFILKDYLEMIFSQAKLVASMLLITAFFNFISDHKLTIAKKNQQSKVDQKSENGRVSQKTEQKPNAVNFKQALIVGLFQALAIIPGISRSGSTVFAGLLVGLDRFSAFEFSFLLGILPVAGASAIQAVELINNPSGQINPIVLLFGFVSALITGWFSLGFFSKIIKQAKLEIFAWYCLIVGLSAVMLL